MEANVYQLYMVLYQCASILMIQNHGVVLIMLNIGLDLGLIGPTLFTMLVLMALFTTFLATPVLDAVHSRTGRQLEEVEA